MTILTQRLYFALATRWGAGHKDYVFHPKQKVPIGEDGSMTVRIKAGGPLEMAGHLCLWGDQVEVIKRATLRKIVKVHARK